MGIVKNIFALLVLAVIFLFTVVVLVATFADAKADGILVSIGGVILFLLILTGAVRFYYRDEIRQRKQSAASDNRPKI